ncbi:MAG: hypothetical protein PW735_03945 [Acidobacteriaceae bacterium]|nr:hypothetical protein [Acidobacteriaceae bacterium]
MKTPMKIWMTTAAAAVLAVPHLALAQDANGTVHGTVNNAAGQLLASGNVEFTTDRTQPKDAKFAYTFPIGQDGTYSGKDIKPGSYVVYVVQDANFVDRQELTVKAGDNDTLNFDMTREEYIKSLSEEDRKKIEEYKKSSAETTAANKVVANLNSTLQAVRADLKSPTPNFDKDEADMKAATAAKPDESVLWLQLGDVLAAKGDSLAAADRKAGKPASSDADLLKAYADSADAYKKGIDLNAASKKPSPNDQAVGYNQMGNVLAHAGKVSESEAAYEAAAKLVPANAGMYYGNEAAIMYNASQVDASLSDGALAAAEKAIAADPNRPAPYFIKGQVLLQKATLDPKTQKIIAPPGCVDAYQKYLELAPDGPQAPAVKEVLGTLGEKIQTHYKAGSKK